jgi:hypothetical protein
MGTNPNTFGGIQETWDKVYQVTHHKKPVYPAITSFRLAAGLEKGDTVNRDYASTLIAKNMGADGSYSRQALTDTNEQLTISYVKEASFYIKKLDEIQNHLPTRMKYANQAAAAIHNQIDADVLGQYDQFTSSIDDGDFGGTDGLGITLDISNVRKLFTKSTKRLQRNNLAIQNLTGRFTGFRDEDAKTGRMVSTLSPDIYQTLLESLDGKESALGDQVGMNGHMGRYFGYDIFVSNALGWSGEVYLPTNPTDGDTLVIGDATLTFKTTVDAGVTAGQVKIASTVDLTRANLAAFINAPLTTVADATNAGYNAFTEDGAAHKSLLNVTATNSDSADTLTLKAVGAGFVVVTETFTAAANVWTTGKQIQHALFGIAGAIEAVIQKTPSIDIKDAPTTRVGKDFVTWAAYGIKVFNEGTTMMVDVRVETSTYTA